MAPRGLRMALALAAAAASVPAADAQFLRGMIGRGYGSSSYFSSSTWTFGRDGEVHEKVQKMSSEVLDTPRGPQRVEKKMVCKDGACREEVVIQPARGPEVGAALLPPVPPIRGMGLRPLEIMNRLMGRLRVPAPPPAAEVVVAVVPVPGPVPGPVLGPMPAAPPVWRAPPPQLSNPYMAAARGAARPLAIGSLVASTALLATLVAALRLQGPPSARELSPAARGALAEPLTSAEGTAPSGPAKPAAAAAAKKAAAEEDSALASTRSYLEGLYVQVIATAEHRAVTRYLGTVYARTAA